MIGLPAPLPHPAPRWALSFADLTLVLLGFLLLLQAHRADPTAVGAGLRAAFGGTRPQMFEERAAPLFQPGEAMLTPTARAHFLTIGDRAARTRARVRVESVGEDPTARRFDGWELAAARAASVARTLSGGGVAADRIDVALDPSSTAVKGQRIRITLIRT